MNDEKNINHPKKLKLKKLTSKKVNSVVNAKTPKDCEALQVGTSSPVKPFKRKSDNCDPEREREPGPSKASKLRKMKGARKWKKGSLYKVLEDFADDERMLYFEQGMVVQFISYHESREAGGQDLLEVKTEDETIGYIPAHLLGVIKRPRFCPRCNNRPYMDEQQFLQHLVTEHFRDEISEYLSRRPLGHTLLCPVMNCRGKFDSLNSLIMHYGADAHRRAELLPRMGDFSQMCQTFKLLDLKDSEICNLERGKKIAKPGKKIAELEKNILMEKSRSHSLECQVRSMERSNMISKTEGDILKELNEDLIVGHKKEIESLKSGFKVQMKCLEDQINKEEQEGMEENPFQFEEKLNFLQRKHEELEIQINSLKEEKERELAARAVEVAELVEQLRAMQEERDELDQQNEKLQREVLEQRKNCVENL